MERSWQGHRDGLLASQLDLARHKRADPRPGAGHPSQERKQQAEDDAYIAEKERLEAAEREAVAEAARRRSVAREALLVALHEGGFSDSEIARNENDGVPMIVVEDKSYAGQRLETWDDISYPGGLRWGNLPTGFTIWGGGRWVGAS